MRWAERLLILLVAVLLLQALPAAPEAAPPPVADLVHRVDLNSAPWHELADLPGIGAVRAREIVRDREARGPFRDVADLQRVPGVGPVTVARVREFAYGGPR